MPSVALGKIGFHSGTPTPTTQTIRVQALFRRWPTRQNHQGFGCRATKIEEMMEWLGKSFPCFSSCADGQMSFKYSDLFRHMCRLLNKFHPLLDILFPNYYLTDKSLAAGQLFKSSLLLKQQKRNITVNNLVKEILGPVSIKTTDYPTDQ